MAPGSHRHSTLSALAVVSGAIAALLVYRRRMFNRRAEEFHQRYG